MDQEGERVQHIAGPLTSKTVETSDSRDLLIFCIRAKIDPDRLSKRAADVRSGLPGLTNFLLGPSAAWPAALRGGANP